MEAISIALVLVGTVALTFRKRRRHIAEHHRPATAKPRRPVRSRSAQTEVLAPKPFDPRTAEAQAGKSSIQGAAYIVDGDTLRIRNTQIRLFGVDAPELNHPYGQKAKWTLQALCKGRIVHADILERDAHGRTVARCKLDDGRDLSAEMVKLGLAIDWPKYSGGEYRTLERSDARKRLWLADARQNGRMHVWRTFEARQAARPQKADSQPRDK